MEILDDPIVRNLDENRIDTLWHDVQSVTINVNVTLKLEPDNAIENFSNFSICNCS